MKTNINRIGVFTSGGDAPGMNAAIRAVVRAGEYYQKEVYGIYRGYHGMINGNIERLEARDVSNIIQRGGTILKTARSEEFRTPEGRQKAYEQLKKFEIDALIAIGGNGTMNGATIFGEEYNIPVIAIPGTIDNDLKGSDVTIGYDTATNTAVDALDKIRDTASSHNRLFFVEVMGRHSGLIAVRSGLAAGAEVILIPEDETPVESIVETLKNSNKNFNLVIVAEGHKGMDIFELAKVVGEQTKLESKVTILGHIQRGGTPTVFDRVLASRLGIAAVECLIEGKVDCMVGMRYNELHTTPLNIAIREGKTINQDVWRISKILST